jgi:hypothetical protein
MFSLLLLSMHGLLSPHPWAGIFPKNNTDFSDRFISPSDGNEVAGWTWYVWQVWGCSLSAWVTVVGWLSFPRCESGSCRLSVTPIHKRNLFRASTACRSDGQQVVTQLEYTSLYLSIIMLAWSPALAAQELAPKNTISPFFASIFLTPQRSSNFDHRFLQWHSQT